MLNPESKLKPLGIDLIEYRAYVIAFADPI